jgi:flavin reductase (DIM6/NTAB) family NADH-FMN oxidoreductase RutF
MNHKIETDPIVDALEQMPYGLYIIGSRGADNINGMMADWVMQVSFQPRLVAVSLERNSTTLKNLK